MKWIAAVLLLVALGLSFWTGYLRGSAKDPEIITIEKHHIVMDTVTVSKPVEPLNYQAIPAHRDTQLVTITRYDTVRQVDVARSWMDTTLVASGRPYGDLFVEYFHPPADRFDLQFDPVPWEKKTITRIVRVPKQKSWYNNEWLWLTVGLVGGACLTSD